MVRKRLLRIVFIFVALASVSYGVFHFRYLIYKRFYPQAQNYRASKIPSGYSVHGIDVSRYQGKINWLKIGKINKTHPVEFVIMRATMGALGEDKEFPRNWEQSKKRQFIRGAYHYYNPNVNSLLQAENFILTVDLDKGDLPPILDIEKVSTIQDVPTLRKGIRKWLEKVEAHYDAVPIIYTSASFYNEYLEGHFDEYPLWIANYNQVRKPIDEDWVFWQFTERGTVEGVRGFVDLNVFNGSKRDMEDFVM